MAKLHLHKKLDGLHQAEERRRGYALLMVLLGVAIVITIGSDYGMFLLGKKATSITNQYVVLDIVIVYALLWWAVVFPGLFGKIVFGLYVAGIAWVAHSLGTLAPEDSSLAKILVQQVQTEAHTRYENFTHRHDPDHLGEHDASGLNGHESDGMAPQGY